MKVIHLVILFSLLSIAACGERNDREKKTESDTGGKGAAVGIKWHSSLPDGLELARKEGKPLMVDFYSDRCKWCAVLDQKTYSDPKVKALSGEFIPVKVDVGKDYGTANKYRITGLPTILFINSAGEVIHKVIGFKPAGPFLAEMNAALNRVKEG